MIRPTSYSANVVLEFRTDSIRIPLSQLAWDFAIAAKQTRLDPCNGEIRMTIDGNETRIPVHLPDGIQLDLLRFRLSPPLGSISASP